MKNEAKAKKIASSQKIGYTVRYSGYTYTEYSEEECYKSAMEMALWKEQQMIEKACEWMFSNHIHYPNNRIGTEQIIKDFKKAMEE